MKQLVGGPFDGQEVEVAGITGPIGYHWISMLPEGDSTHPDWQRCDYNILLRNIEAFYCWNGEVWLWCPGIAARSYVPEWMLRPRPKTVAEIEEWYAVDKAMYERTAR
ncbi:hypothetical protein [Rhodococcoides fascians]|uniref:hypothetical protein n=1 Tax=Rhodococcoides fascians TaxID=1828 RepID=UPI00050C8952|nr:hypothetical protein [Rhodococcus fascians]